MEFNSAFKGLTQLAGRHVTTSQFQAHSLTQCGGTLSPELDQTYTTFSFCAPCGTQTYSLFFSRSLFYRYDTPVRRKKHPLRYKYWMGQNKACSLERPVKLDAG